jgi:hypothetical protein
MTKGDRLGQGTGKGESAGSYSSVFPDIPLVPAPLYHSLFHPLPQPSLITPASYRLTLKLLAGPTPLVFSVSRERITVKREHEERGGRGAKG